MAPRPDSGTRTRGADLLMRWRRRAKLAQQDAAKAVGLDPCSYNRFERGGEVPGLKRAHRIAEATNGAVPIKAWVEAAR
jgi:DNA-binding XRE family transcriptional regulator